MCKLVFSLQENVYFILFFTFMLLCAYKVNFPNIPFIIIIITTRAGP